MARGSVALVLHAHLPFVRHPEHEDFLEERWLYEAITETYLPLLEMLASLERDHVPVRLTLSLSPTLLGMFADPLLRARYLHHLDRLVELAEKEERRTRGDPAFHRLAAMYLSRFSRSRTAFLTDWQQDLIGAFRGYQERGLIDIRVVNLREYADGKHRVTDDYQFGGGGGMVLKPEPLFGAVEALRTPTARVVLLDPRGRRFTQEIARELGAVAHLILLAGRYEGVDERVSTALADDEVSIGDYVLTGGELPALVVADAVARLIPGVLGDAAAAGQDSFARGLLEGPQYTRPEEFHGLRVPDVLLSGDHQKIARWRRAQALWRTWQRRPDLLETAELTPAEQKLVEEFRRGKGPDESWMRSA